MEQSIRTSLAVARRTIRCIATTTSQHEQQQNPSEYCASVVRTTDPHFHACALLMPAETRRCALAVAAYSVEIANIRDATQDAQLAKLRMQYWRDCLELIYSAEEGDGIDPGEYPVVRELERVVGQHNLPKHYLEKLLLSRERYIGGRVCKDLEEVYAYSEAAFSPIYYAMLHTAGVTKDACPKAYSAASHAGRTVGLLRFLSASAALLMRGRCELPEADLRRHGITQADLRAAAADRTPESPSAATERLSGLVREVAGSAEAHHQCLRADLLEAGPHMPPDARLVFLPLVGTATLLARVQQANYNLFALQWLHDTQRTAPPVSYSRLLLCRWLRRIDLHV